jgi:hypothetical protein
VLCSSTRFKWVRTHEHCSHTHTLTQTLSLPQSLTHDHARLPTHLPRSHHCTYTLLQVALKPLIDWLPTTICWTTSRPCMWGEDHFHLPFRLRPRWSPPSPLFRTLASFSTSVLCHATATFERWRTGKCGVLMGCTTQRVYILLVTLVQMNDVPSRETLTHMQQTIHPPRCRTPAWTGICVSGRWTAKLRTMGFGRISWISTVDRTEM